MAITRLLCRKVKILRWLGATNVPAVKFELLTEQDAFVTGVGAQTTAISGAAVDANFAFKAGIHSNFRYVRPNIVSTGVTNGATISMYGNLASASYADLITLPIGGI